MTDTTKRAETLAAATFKALPNANPFDAAWGVMGQLNLKGAEGDAFEHAFVQAWIRLQIRAVGIDGRTYYYGRHNGGTGGSK